MAMTQLTFLPLLIFSYAGSVCDATPASNWIIMSPNYPKNYPGNIRKEWDLTSFEPAYIFLQIRNFSTKSTVDTVSITDGFGFLLKLAGQQPPRNFTLSLPVVIVFDAIGFDTAQGFEMEYNSIARSQTATDSVCGGTIVGYGIIKSPTYQDIFYTNVSCWWTLQAYVAADIFLRIRHFSTRSLNVDFVTISDAAGFQHSLSPKNVISNFTLSSPANISFIAYSLLTALRFEMEFNSIPRFKESFCGGIYLGQGIIKSPNYPNDYSNNVSCTWTLESYDGAHIYLQIRNFSTVLNNDFLLLTDASRFQLSLSGLEQQRNFTLSSPAVITFITDFSETAQGFEMEFSSIALAQDNACGGKIVGYGVIKSPNYPEHYALNASCKWTLQAYDEAHVFLQVRMCSMELFSENVTIQDASKFVYILLTGQQPPRNFTLSSPVTIVFSADRDVTANGFEIEFSSKGTNKDSTCGGTMVGYGLINVNNYPEKFLKNITCLWTLRAYDEGDIFLQIRRFSTQSDYDIVLITDASGIRLSLFGKQQPKNVTLSSPANISFITGTVMIAQEFEMEFSSILQSKATSSSCGGIIYGNGVIQPPKNPEKKANISCLWTLVAYGAHDIFLQIRRFSAESGYDFVVIADTSGRQKMLSGQQKPQNVTLSSPANISFQAGNLLTGPDFELAFSSIPRLNAQSGAENDYRLTVILSSVIPLLFIFGAVAVTIGVILSRKKRIYPEIVSVSTKCNSGASYTQPPPARQVAERTQEPTYASLGNIGDDLYDNIYDEIVYQSHGSTSSD